MKVNEIKLCFFVCFENNIPPTVAQTHLYTHNPKLEIEIS